MRKNLLITLALMAAPTISMAEDFGDYARVEVLTGWRTAAGDHVAAVEITLAPGWITYWRAPGDSGIPPQFSFESDTNIESITPHWPVPQVYEDAGLRSIGYYDSVIFPLTVITDGATGDIPVSGQLTIGVCDEICIPVNFSFDTVLPAVGQANSAISAALADKPLTGRDAHVGDVTCAIDPISDGLRMTTTIDVAKTGSSEVVVVEPSDPSVWVSQAEVSREGQLLTATVEMVHPSGEPFAFDRSGVRITVLGDDQAIDLRGCKAG